MNIQELRTHLEAKQDEAARIVGAYTSVNDWSADDAEKFGRLQMEMTDFGKKIDELVARERAAKSVQDAIAERSEAKNRLGTPQAPAGQAPVKSFGEILRESKEYAAFRDGATKTAQIYLPAEVAAQELGVKTLMTLTTINNAATRRPGIQNMALEQRTVADMILGGQLDNNAMTYMEETTHTNAAAAVAEGGTKPESALAFTERTDNVRKIATWIPATDELLADVTGMESYIRGRLAFMVERELEDQIINGDGTAPNISGILDRTGIQTQALGADDVPTAIYLAMTKVRNVAFAEPTGVVIHPNDWAAVVTLKDTNGNFIWGQPQNAMQNRIWGLEVRETSVIAEGTALVGAFRPDAQLFMRQGVTITVSTEHSTYFVENKVAILAELRALLAVYRPASFVTVTGI